MHQRQPIQIDKGRAFSAENGPVSNPTQVSFHKIYRKKRCYSVVDKEQDGHGSSQWKAGYANSQRDNNTGLRSNYSSGSNSFKPTRRIDARQSNNYNSHPVSPPTRESPRNYRQHLKRPNDRLGCNSVSGPEFDIPFVKKQKVENYKFRALQHFPPEIGQGEQKFSLDDTKWMYKNQHAKMSGPYGVRQLIEGFYARFLQEDLPVYQLHEGKLGRPIMLRQLVDDLESCNLHNPASDSQTHDPASHFNQSFSEEGFNHVAPVKDMDLPPGFGGHSAQFSDRPSCIDTPNSTASSTGTKCPVGAFSSPSPDYGGSEFDLPPGFETIAGTPPLIETHTRDLQGSSKKLSAGARVAVRNEGAEGMQLGYEKCEPIVYCQSRPSHQGSSPHSKLSFTILPAKSSSSNPMQLEPIVHNRGHLCQQGSSPPSKGNFIWQGTRNLNENASRHATWAFASPTAGLPNVEAQTFTSPIVCIGLPVSNPALQTWPVGNNLQMSHAQANNEFLPKEYSECTVMHGVTPLDLIYSELLAAVKRSYVKTVLSALIDEQLKYWIDARDTMVKSLLPEDCSRLRDACSLSSTDFGVTCLETTVLQIDAPVSLPMHSLGSVETLLQVPVTQSSDGGCLKVHVGSSEQSSEPRNSQCFDVNNRSIHMPEYQCPSVEAFSIGNAGNTHNPFAMTDVRSPSDKEQNSLGTPKIPCLKTTVQLDLVQTDSFVPCDEALKSPSKSSCLGNGFDNVMHIAVDQREEKHPKLADETLQGDGALVGKVQSSGNPSDAVYLESEPSFLVSGKKKWKLKSLKRLMQITSKLRPRHSKISSFMSKKEEMPLGKFPETSERKLLNGLLIPKDYNGCARTTFDGLLWCKLAGRALYSESFVRDSSLSLNKFNAQTAQKHKTQLQKPSAAAISSFAPDLRQSEAKLKVGRSKIHKWGLFAVEPVEAGDFVVEYVGEVVRPRVSDIRKQHYKNLGIGSGFLFYVDDEMVVDATKRGGIARFMNHSCDPNCCTKLVTVEGLKKVYIYAKRHITTGEELTYDYKFQLEDQKIPCNCGSTRCCLQIEACK